MTRRMKSGRFTKGGGRRSSGRKPSRGRRGGRRTVTVSRIGGAALIADGILQIHDPTGKSGVGAPLAVIMPGADHSFKDATYNLKANVPFLGKDPGHEGQRSEATAGLVLLLGGKLASALGLRSPSFRVGRRRVRLWG